MLDVRLFLSLSFFFMLFKILGEWWNPAECRQKPIRCVFVCRTMRVGVCHFIDEMYTRQQNVTNLIVIWLLFSLFCFFSLFSAGRRRRRIFPRLGQHNRGWMNGAHRCVMMNLMIDEYKDDASFRRARDRKATRRSFTCFVCFFLFFVFPNRWFFYWCSIHLIFWSSQNWAVAAGMTILCVSLWLFSFVDFFAESLATGPCALCVCCPYISFDIRFLNKEFISRMNSSQNDPNPNNTWRTWQRQTNSNTIIT